ncbi:MAG: leucine--tRNA ligase [Phycisphaerales bacterium]|nr:leucine--tRNA ligase [Hyphomonadaceae bacterium]
MSDIGKYHDQVGRIEADLQAAWKAEGVDKTNLESPNAQRCYVLGMFPYPSGNAHLGHMLVYSISDALARLARFQGASVVHPLGWDAFGLPAENAAIKNNIHPALWTEQNISRMRDEQLRRAGFSFDLDLELNTSSPDYYRWTQWLFLKLYEHGQVYRSKSWVNWDPVDETVLANEQVIDGRGWRSGAPIERRLMEQWCFRVTDFAEDLWNGLDNLTGWSERAIAAQRNWIGRSEGADIDFALADADQRITVFTTRPDTLFGVTSVTLAPEHPLTGSIAAKDASVAAYVESALKLSEVDRQAGSGKTGVFAGCYAVHPITSQQVPIYVSAYVLGGYGSGAIMNVPAHDQRDMDFARAVNLPLRTVVAAPGDAQEEPSALAFEDDGVLVNSAEFSGLTSKDARKQIVEVLETRNLGRKVVRYRLRDWSVSRQRFWGAPIPMVRDADGDWHPVPESDLPVTLPAEVNFGVAKGRSPLAQDPAFLRAEIAGDPRPATRETDTMDTFMCSAWYAWRFLDPKNAQCAWRASRAEQWMPINYYVGGLEHANQHLIYFRYMAHFLHSIGLTPTKEPVTQFLDNGMIRLGGHKMSKSRGNAVTPDEMIDKYGADALRLYILSDAPFERDRDWDESGLEAKQRFLSRIFTLYQNTETWAALQSAPSDLEGPSKALVDAIHAEAANIESSLQQRRSFHTAVATLHSTLNTLIEASRTNEVQKAAFAYCLQTYLKMLGLFAPHIADFLWRAKFGSQSLFKERWPFFDRSALARAAETVHVAVQVDGKRRGELECSPAASDDDLRGILAAAEEGIARYLADMAIDRVIIVRDKHGRPKLLNVVLKD